MYTSLKKMFNLLLFFVFIQLSYAQNTPQVILKGDYADPTIIRDGSDYYMTHSPFVYAPGFLLWHSTDLINWKPLVRTNTAITGSAYAPDLVKYDNKYYIYYPANGTNYVIWAEDIKGPWSQPIDLKTPRIDPGHIADDNGNRFLHLSNGEVVQLAQDGLSSISKPEKTYSGWKYPSKWNTECFCLESPKLIKHNDYYYLISAQGGTAGPATSHMVVVARSKNVDGPWENAPNNPIVHTYSAQDKWWSKGHGTFIDDADGNWWVVYHAYNKDAYTLGRHTLIEPIKYTEDGWFELDPTRDIPKISNDFQSLELSDDFNGTDIGLQWTVWGAFLPQENKIENGKIHLKSKGSDISNGHKLLTTLTDENYALQTKVAVSENTGGLILYYKEQAYAGITVSADSIALYNAANAIKKVPNRWGREVHLRIENQNNLCSFAISKDGMVWDTLKEHVDVSGLHHNNYRGFYALRGGLLSAGSGTVEYDYFKYASGKRAAKPLYRDPVFDGAADPVVIWNPISNKWWMYYTNRRATETQLPGVSWVFKTEVGIAQSEDGANWEYVGTANFPKLPENSGGKSATLWAPDVIKGPDGLWHMFLSIQAGEATSWGKVPGYIDQFTSDNLRDWTHKHRFELPVGSYDAEVLQMPDESFRMYHKDPSGGASTFYYSESKDLKQWSDRKKVFSAKGEGPAIFKWKDWFWMILCDGQGFATYRSKDAQNWERQPGGALMPHGSGIGEDDIPAARHGDVVVQNNRAYLFYFTHPGRHGTGKDLDGFDQRRSSIQVVELKLENNWLVASRNEPTYINLTTSVQN